MDGAWLNRRSPPPPDDLTHRMREAVVDSPGTESRIQALLDGATRSLTAARQEPGRVRASAFHLLTADALVTYACEEALDAVDAEAELAKLLAIATLA